MDISIPLTRYTPESLIRGRDEKMDLESDTLLGDLLKRYPYLLEYLQKLSPAYERLKDEEMRERMGDIATLEMVASMGGLNLHDLAGSISGEVKKVSGDNLSYEGGGTPAADRKRMEKLKRIIRDLHDGRTVEDVKSRFEDVIKNVNSVEIARMEQELIDEGLPQEEIKRLCDVHVEIFRGGLEEAQDMLAPPGHPVHTFMKENQALEGLLSVLSTTLNQVESEQDPEKAFDEKRSEISGLLRSVSEIKNHYLRKENQLFPVLESKGVSGPSQVMWSIHDDIRDSIRSLLNRIEHSDLHDIKDDVRETVRNMKDMIYKEEKVLLPMSLEKLSEEEWSRLREGEGEIGYSWIKPDKGWKGVRMLREKGSGDNIKLDEGSLNPDQINSILKTLPVDISFVDHEDKVVYYSATGERIFPRSPNVIGREVKYCHPPKSVHVVRKILDEFRNGNKDAAEFWIRLQGKFVYIRYFAVRNDEGRYLGCLEVSQDVTRIRKLEGEKRLLDWEGA
jgi:DUF438 domain-containing protein